MRMALFIAASLNLSSLYLAAGPAYSQGASQTSADQQQPGNRSLDARGDAAPQGRVSVTSGKWRASEVVGTTVYNNDGAVVATADDILISQQGDVQFVILSVTGALGLGGKLVSVPFSQFKFMPSKDNPDSSGNGPTVAGLSNAPEAKGNGAKSSAAKGASSATSQQYRDFGLVLPNATTVSLRASPAYHYSSGN